MEKEQAITADIFLSFRKVYNRAKVNINKVLLDESITLQHAVYLMALDKCKTATVKELNFFTGNDSGLTSRSLKKLYKLSLIDKTQKNMKKALLYLTERGKEVLAKTMDALSNAYEYLFARLNTRDVATLHKLAGKIN